MVPGPPSSGSCFYAKHAPRVRSKVQGGMHHFSQPLVSLDDPEASIEVGQYTQKLTFDVIMKCAMGVDTECQTNSDMSSPSMVYFQAIFEVARLTMLRYRQPWTWPDFIYHRTASGKLYAKAVLKSHTYSEHLIRQRREVLEEEQQASDGGAGRDDRNDMLGTLLTVRDEDGIGMSDSEIRDQVATFLFAGRDTSSAALQWAMYYLTKHPDIQEKCRAEVLRVMESCGGVDGFQHEHIAQLQYLTCFVLEMLRCACIVGSLTRTLMKDASVDGVHVPAGTNVLVSIMGVHYSDQVWDDPKTFNPDRFASGKERHPYAFIPFAAGARSCIGKYFVQDEIKVVLAMLLAKFVLLPDPDAIEPYWRLDIASRPYPHLRIKIREVS